MVDSGLSFSAIDVPLIVAQLDTGHQISAKEARQPRSRVKRALLHNNLAGNLVDVSFPRMMPAQLMNMMELMAVGRS